MPQTQFDIDVRGTQVANHCKDHPNFRISAEARTLLGQFPTVDADRSSKRITRSAKLDEERYPSDWVVDPPAVRRVLKQLCDEARRRREIDTPATPANPSLAESVRLPIRFADRQISTKYGSRLRSFSHPQTRDGDMPVTSAAPTGPVGTVL
ncbi:hypothetical protein N7516_001374 [Penicillium verrucosum]|uniref:uncharacterized protein n=1 Tax=Penicillium verrucosum TaxID=60171 RepID=UPI00254535B8|nr:uncharacterized protein N7516_001374 [Penicillium verrucosum]KAJ5941206.1 hypothetical protein N7516_001374 [Penicillium verrucosum]